MNDKLKNDNIGFTLRSEKVRSLMGEMPSSLIRYGMLVITLILFILFITASIIPYNKIYSGKVVSYDVFETNKDSVRISFLLEFEKNNIIKTSSKGIIILMADNHSIVGHVVAIDYSPDFRNSQVFQCVFLLNDYNTLSNQISEFKLVISKGSLLKNIFLKNNT